MEEISFGVMVKNMEIKKEITYEDIWDDLKKDARKITRCLINELNENSEKVIKILFDKQGE